MLSTTRSLANFRQVSSGTNISPVIIELDKRKAFLERYNAAQAANFPDDLNLLANLLDEPYVNKAAFLDLIVSRT